MPYRLIDPDETLDFTFDWSDFLAPPNAEPDRIECASWFVSPPGPTLSNQARDGAVASTLISGARLGEVYVLTNRVVTAAGRAAEKSVMLACENV